MATGLTLCDFCGYPQYGDKSAQIAYNIKLGQVRDWLQDAARSVQGVWSFGIIFFFMALVTASFSLIFHENHFRHTLVLLLVGLVYWLLSRLGKTNAYLMSALALIFYLSHTIFEFSYQMYLKSPIGLSNPFSEGFLASFIFVLVPLGYLVFRLALVVVLAKFYLLSRKLKNMRTL